MRSPLMVPLVLLTLILLLTEGEAAQKSKTTNRKSGKVCAEKAGMRTVEAAQSRATKMVNNNVQVNDLRVRSEKRVPEVGEEVTEDVLRDEKMLKAVESNFLSLFGMKRRPRSNRNVVIPDAMKELYRRQTGMEVETTNFALPGRLTGSANTVRSFIHQGKLFFIFATKLSSSIFSSTPESISNSLHSLTRDKLGWL